LGKESGGKEAKRNGGGTKKEIKGNVRGGKAYTRWKHERSL